MSRRGSVLHDLWPALILLGAAAVAVFVIFSSTLARNPNIAWAAVLQCLLIPLGLFAARSLAGPLHPASAIALVAYSQVILFVARPLYQAAQLEARNPFTTDPYSTYVIMASLLAGIGFVCLALGYGWAMRRHRVLLPVHSTDGWMTSLGRPYRHAVGLTAGIGFALYSVYVIQTGPSQFLAGVLDGRSAIMKSAAASSTAYLYAGLQFATGSMLFLLLQARIRGDRVLQWVLLFAIALAMAPDVLGGNRSVFVPVVTAVALTLYATNPRLFSPLRVVTALPLLFVFGITAPRIWRDQLERGGSIGDAVSSALDPSNALAGFLGGLDTAMVDALEVQVYAQAQGLLPFQYGSTYLAALTGVIPSTLWPGKPETVDQVLNARLFPITDAQGIGFSFSVYSEPFFNFGVLGVVAACLFFGWALGLLTRWATVNASPISVFVWIMCVSYIFPIMRGSFSFDLQRLLVVMLPPLLAVLVVDVSTRNLSRHPSHRDLLALRG